SERAARVAALEKRCPEIEMGERVAGSERQRLAQRLDRLRPAPFRHRVGAADFEGAGVLQQRRDLAHQRVVRRRIRRAAYPKLGISFTYIAQPAVRKRQRVMDARGPWFNSQCGGETL